MEDLIGSQIKFNSAENIESTSCNQATNNEDSDISEYMFKFASKWTTFMPKDDFFNVASHILEKHNGFLSDFLNIDGDTARIPAKSVATDQKTSALGNHFPVDKSQILGKVCEVQNSCDSITNAFGSIKDDAADGSRHSNEFLSSTEKHDIENGTEKIMKIPKNPCNKPVGKINNLKEFDVTRQMMLNNNANMQRFIKLTAQNKRCEAEILKQPEKSLVSVCRDSKLERKSHKITVNTEKRIEGGSGGNIFAQPNDSDMEISPHTEDSSFKSDKFQVPKDVPKDPRKRFIFRRRKIRRYFKIIRGYEDTEEPNVPALTPIAPFTLNPKAINENYKRKCFKKTNMRQGSKNCLLSSKTSKSLARNKFCNANKRVQSEDYQTSDSRISSQFANEKLRSSWLSVFEKFGNDILSFNDPRSKKPSCIANKFEKESNPRSHCSSNSSGLKKNSTRAFNQVIPALNDVSEFKINNDNIAEHTHLPFPPTVSQSVSPSKMHKMDFRTFRSSSPIQIKTHRTIYCPEKLDESIKISRLHNSQSATEIPNCTGNFKEKKYLTTPSSASEISSPDSCFTRIFGNSVEKSQKSVLSPSMPSLSNSSEIQNSFRVYSPSTPPPIVLFSDCISNSSAISAPSPLPSPLPEKASLHSYCFPTSTENFARTPAKASLLSEYSSNSSEILERIKKKHSNPSTSTDVVSSSDRKLSLNIFKTLDGSSRPIPPTEKTTLSSQNLSNLEIFTNNFVSPTFPHDEILPSFREYSSNNSKILTKSSKELSRPSELDKAPQNPECSKLSGIFKNNIEKIGPRSQPPETASSSQECSLNCSKIFTNSISEFRPRSPPPDKAQLNSKYSNLSKMFKKSIERNMSCSLRPETVSYQECSSNTSKLFRNCGNSFRTRSPPPEKTSYQDSSMNTLKKFGNSINIPRSISPPEEASSSQEYYLNTPKLSRNRSSITRPPSPPPEKATFQEHLSNTSKVLGNCSDTPFKPNPPLEKASISQECSSNISKSSKNCSNVSRPPSPPPEKATFEEYLSNTSKILSNCCDTPFEANPPFEKASSSQECSSNTSKSSRHCSNISSPSSPSLDKTSYRECSSNTSKMCGKCCMVSRLPSPPPEEVQLNPECSNSTEIFKNRIEKYYLCPAPERAAPQKCYFNTSNNDLSCSKIPYPLSPLPDKASSSQECSLHISQHFRKCTNISRPPSPPPEKASSCQEYSSNTSKQFINSCIFTRPQSSHINSECSNGLEISKNSADKYGSCCPLPDIALFKNCSLNASLHLGHCSKIPLSPSTPKKKTPQSIKFSNYSKLLANNIADTQNSGFVSEIASPSPERNLEFWDKHDKNNEKSPNLADGIVSTPSKSSLNPSGCFEEYCPFNTLPTSFNDSEIKQEILSDYEDSDVNKDLHFSLLADHPHLKHIDQWLRSKGLPEILTVLSDTEDEPYSTLAKEYDENATIFSKSRVNDIESSNSSHGNVLPGKKRRLTKKSSKLQKHRKSKNYLSPKHVKSKCCSIFKPENNSPLPSKSPDLSKTPRSLTKPDEFSKVLKCIKKNLDKSLIEEPKASVLEPHNPDPLACNSLTKKVNCQSKFKEFSQSGIFHKNNDVSPEIELSIHPKEVACVTEKATSDYCTKVLSESCFAPKQHNMSARKELRQPKAVAFNSVNEKATARKFCKVCIPPKHRSDLSVKKACSRESKDVKVPNLKLKSQENPFEKYVDSSRSTHQDAVQSSKKEKSQERSTIHFITSSDSGEFVSDKHNSRRHKNSMKLNKKVEIEEPPTKKWKTSPSSGKLSTDKHNSQKHEERGESRELPVKKLKLLPESVELVVSSKHKKTAKPKEIEDVKKLQRQKSQVLSKKSGAFHMEKCSCQTDAKTANDSKKRKNVKDSEKINNYIKISIDKNHLSSVQEASATLESNISRRKKKAANPEFTEMPLLVKELNNSKSINNVVLAECSASLKHPIPDHIQSNRPQKSTISVDKTFMGKNKVSHSVIKNNSDDKNKVAKNKINSETRDTDYHSTETFAELKGRINKSGTVEKISDELPMKNSNIKHKNSNSKIQKSKLELKNNRSSSNDRIGKQCNGKFHKITKSIPVTTSSYPSTDLAFKFQHSNFINELPNASIQNLATENIRFHSMDMKTNSNLEHVKNCTDTTYDQALSNKKLKPNGKSENAPSLYLAARNTSKVPYFKNTEKKSNLKPKRDTKTKNCVKVSHKPLKTKDLLIDHEYLADRNASNSSSEKNKNVLPNEETSRTSSEVQPGKNKSDLSTSINNKTGNYSEHENNNIDVPEKHVATNINSVKPKESTLPDLHSKVLEAANSNVLECCRKNFESGSTIDRCPVSKSTSNDKIIEFNDAYNVKHSERVSDPLNLKNYKPVLPDTIAYTKHLLKNVQIVCPKLKISEKYYIPNVRSNEISPVSKQNQSDFFANSLHDAQSSAVEVTSFEAGKNANNTESTANKSILRKQKDSKTISENFAIKTLNSRAKTSSSESTCHDTIDLPVANVRILRSRTIVLDHVYVRKKRSLFSPNIKNSKKNLKGTPLLKTVNINCESESGFIKPLESNADEYLDSPKKASVTTSSFNATLENDSSGNKNYILSVKISEEKTQDSINNENLPLTKEASVVQPSLIDASENDIQSNGDDPFSIKIQNPKRNKNLDLAKQAFDVLPSCVPEKCFPINRDCALSTVILEEKGNSRMNYLPPTRRLETCVTNSVDDYKTQEVKNTSYCDRSCIKENEAIQQNTDIPESRGNSDYECSLVKPTESNTVDSIDENSDRERSVYANSTQSVKRLDTEHTTNCYVSNNSPTSSIEGVDILKSNIQEIRAKTRQSQKVPTNTSYMLLNRRYHKSKSDQTSFNPTSNSSEISSNKQTQVYKDKNSSNYNSHFSKNLPCKSSFEDNRFQKYNCSTSYCSKNHFCEQEPNEADTTKTETPPNSETISCHPTIHTSRSDLFTCSVNDTVSRNANNVIVCGDETGSEKGCTDNLKVKMPENKNSIERSINSSSIGSQKDIVKTNCITDESMKHSEYHIDEDKLELSSEIEKWQVAFHEMYGNFVSPFDMKKFLILRDTLETSVKDENCSDISRGGNTVGAPQLEESTPGYNIPIAIDRNDPIIKNMKTEKVEDFEVSRETNEDQIKPVVQFTSCFSNKDRAQITYEGNGVINSITPKTSTPGDKPPIVINRNDPIIKYMKTEKVDDFEVPREINEDIQTQTIVNFMGSFSNEERPQITYEENKVVIKCSNEEVYKNFQIIRSPGIL